MIGERISHYRIIEKLGSGGMGVVYKAEDTKLGRQVALKFLPDELCKKPQSLERFKHEARSASALNHPHICTIYDIDEDQGKPFIAMELLEGRTLKDRIGGKPMPVDDICNLGIQIADALNAAHASGLVHRDVKPTNIFVSDMAYAKLMDFGIAKFGLRPSQAVDATTIPLGEATAPGTIYGTLLYMSPEQARGEELDLRSDLFSFGSVLYEMATGKPAFAAKTPALVLEGILNRIPPPPSSINPEIPPALNKIICRLLEKDRRLRYPNAVEIKNDLAAVQRESVTPVSGKPPRLARIFRVAVAGGLLLLIIALSYRLFVRNFENDNVDLPDLSFAQLTRQDGMELFPSLSPDGKFVAYASHQYGNLDIFTQRVGGQNPTNLTMDSPADDTQPAFSPNGEFIAFRSEREGGGIYIMGATGESVRRLTDFGYNPSWSPDGNRVVVADETIGDPTSRFGRSKLWIINVAGGQRMPVGVEDGVQPVWSPHNLRISYNASKEGQRDIWTVRIDGTGPERLTSGSGTNWSAIWSPDGKTVYFSSDRGGSMNLWRVPVDEASGKPLGTVQPITTGGGLARRQHATISADGKRIAYVEQLLTENVQRMSIDPVSGSINGTPALITHGTRIAAYPDPSPDGKMVTFQSLGQQEDIFVIGTNGTGERQLTSDVYRDRVPRWSPDGKHIAFYSNRSGAYQIWIIRPDGSDLKPLTMDPRANSIRAAWSPDGKHIAGHNDERQRSFIMDLDESARPTSFEQLPPMNDPAEYFLVWSWSPDGKWLAGRRVIRDSGESKGVVLYSLQSHEYLKLTDDEGTGPVWLNDSRRLLIEKQGKIDFIDTLTKDVRGALAFDTRHIVSVAQPAKANPYLYYSIQDPQADVWLITLR